MIDKKIDENEASELKNFIITTLVKEKKIMKNTSFRVEDVFRDIKHKYSISPERIIKPKAFLSRNNMNIKFVSR